MVTINGYAERKRKDGSSFIVLELSGGVELVMSQLTGRYYATLKRAFVPCTFPESVASELVGQKLPGEIVRVICEPYEYTNPTTNEVMILRHSYAFSPDPARQEGLIGHTRVTEMA